MSTTHTHNTAEPLASRAEGYPRREAEKPLFPLSVSPAARRGEYDPLVHAAVGDKVEHGADGPHRTCSISSVSVLQSGELWAEAEVIIKIKLSPELQRHEPLLGQNLAQEISQGAKEALAGSALATSLIRDELVAREEKSKEEYRQMGQKGLRRAPPEEARKPHSKRPRTKEEEKEAEERRRRKRFLKNRRHEANKARREAEAAAARAAAEKKTPPTPSPEKAQQEPAQEAPRLIVSAPPPPQAALPPLTGPPPRSAGMGALEEWWKLVRQWHPEIPPGDGPFRTMADASYHSQVGLKALSLYAFLDWLPQPKEEPLVISRFNYSDSEDEDPANQCDSGADTEPIEGFANNDK